MAETYKSRVYTDRPAYADCRQMDGMIEVVGI